MKYLKLFEDFSKDYEYQKGKQKAEKKIDAALKKDGVIRINKKGKQFTKLYRDEQGGSKKFKDRHKIIDTYPFAKKAIKNNEN